MGSASLLLHGLLKSLLVVGQSLFPQDLRRKIRRKPIGVVQLKGLATIQNSPPGQLHIANRVIQHGQTAFQGGPKSLFFGPCELRGEIQPLDQLRIFVPHGLHRDFHRRSHKILFDAQHKTIPYGPSHNAAQDIASAGIGRRHIVGQNKRHRPSMVGDDAKRNIFPRIGFEFSPGTFLNMHNHWVKDIVLEVREFALHNSGNAVQTRSRVDVFSCQGLYRAIGLRVELREDEVPVFKVAFIFFARPGVRTVLRTHIVV